MCSGLFRNGVNGVLLEGGSETSPPLIFKLVPRSVNHLFSAEMRNLALNHHYQFRTLDCVAR